MKHRMLSFSKISEFLLTSVSASAIPCTSSDIALAESCVSVISVGFWSLYLMCALSSMQMAVIVVLCIRENTKWKRNYGVYGIFWFKLSHIFWCTLCSMSSKLGSVPTDITTNHLGTSFKIWYLINNDLISFWTA